MLSSDVGGIQLLGVFVAMAGDSEEKMRATYEAMVRIIREQDAPKPAEDEAPDEVFVD
jgi:hypothetical protein